MIFFLLIQIALGDLITVQPQGRYYAHYMNGNNMERLTEVSKEMQEDIFLLNASIPECTHINFCIAFMENDTLLRVKSACGGSFPSLGNTKVVSLNEYDGFEPEKIYLIKYFTHWCRHSIALVENYTKVAEAFAIYKDIEIAEIDCEENDCEGIEGYPTLKMLVDGEFYDYEFENRTLESMFAFVNKYANSNVLVDGIDVSKIASRPIKKAIFNFYNSSDPKCISDFYPKNRVDMRYFEFFSFFLARKNGFYRKTIQDLQERIDSRQGTAKRYAMMLKATFQEIRKVNTTWNIKNRNNCKGLRCLLCILWEQYCLEHFYGDDY